MAMMLPLSGDPIGSLLVFGAEGFDLQPKLLNHDCADKCTDSMGLPAGRLHDGGERGAFGSPHHRQDVGLLTTVFRHRTRRVAFLAFSRGCLPLPGHERDVGRWLRDQQPLNRLPDSCDGGAAAGELLHRLQIMERSHTRKTVPGFDEPGCGPIGGNLGEFFLTGERLRFVGTGGLPGVYRDVVVGVNGECLHSDTFITPLQAKRKRIV